MKKPGLGFSQPRQKCYIAIMLTEGLLHTGHTSSNDGHVIDHPAKAVLSREP